MGNAAENQHAVIGARQSLDDEFRTPRNEWFFKGGLLGLFMHYGISTVNGEGDLSWGMVDATPWDADEGGNFTITPREYYNLAREFNPVHFDPDNWLRAAKDAGFTYAVFTTRHHDGFSMWPSDVSELSTKNFMHGRDLVGEYIEACRKNGIKAGLYYSPPDWYLERYYRSFFWKSFEPDKYPGFKPGGLDHEELDELLPIPAALQDDILRYVDAQLRELLTRYGKIDILWFDGAAQDLKRVLTPQEIFELQPDIVMNDRMYGKGYNSQYECSMPKEKPPTFFEHCDIWMENCGWAHMKRCTGYRSAQWAYDKYKKISEWGGNTLLNVGPTADGTLPDVYYQRMSELKALLAEGK